MPATMGMLQLCLLSWTALGPGASFIGRSQLTLANKRQPKGGDDAASRILSSERSCDFCDGANRTRSWHWPQCERCRSGSARIACWLRGKAAIFQSARECPGGPGNCPGSKMGSTARTVAEQAVHWFAPLRPRKVDPRIPPEPPHCPRMAGPSVHCFNSVPVAVARSRAASDPSPKYTMLISILHPSSGDATYQVDLNTSKKRTMAKVNPGPAPPRASTRCSRDPCQEGAVLTIQQFEDDIKAKKMAI